MDRADARQQQLESRQWRLSMSLRTYLPSLPQVSREAIAVLAATVVAAYVITKVPALQRLVRGGSIPSPLDPY